MLRGRSLLLWLPLLGCEINPAFDPGLDGGGSGSGTAGGGTPSVQVSELQAQWTTPNQIRWHWAAQGNGDELLRFELVTAPTEADVRGRTAAAHVWTEDENPELGRYLLPHTGAGDPVVATTTDIHEPDQVVHAQLVAIDTAGRRSISNVAAGRTTPPPVGAIVVFSETDMPGYSLPDTFQISDADPYQGTYHYRFVSDCGGPPECWNNLRRQDLGIDLSAMSQGNYLTTAYLELALRIADTDPPWWSEAWTWYDQACGADCITQYVGWTARVDGAYHVLQIPLRAFTRGADLQPAPFDELAADGLFGFDIGGSWADGATVDVDEIRIRW